MSFFEDRPLEVSKAVHEAAKKELQRIADELVEKAGKMRVPPEVQGACLHDMVGKNEDDTYYCVDCGKQVYPDPEWFEKGFLIYGG